MKLWRGSKLRRAGAAVEMAVVAPLLITILFGIIEYGWLFSVQQNLVNAAREGARIGTLNGMDASDVQSRVNEFLDPLGLASSATVTVVEATPDEPNVVVRVSVPISDVAIMGTFFHHQSDSLEAMCTMRKEGF